MESKEQFKASKDHCRFVFKTLIAKLNREAMPIFPPSLPSAKTPLFVTYYKGKNKSLRGCIGTFSQDEETSELLPKYALIAAFQDNRFDPIKANEVPDLTVEVSFLTNFEVIQDPYDWEMMKHGISLDISINGKTINPTNYLKGGITGRLIFLTLLNILTPKMNF